MLALLAILLRRWSRDRLRRAAIVLGIFARPCSTATASSRRRSRCCVRSRASRSRPGFTRFVPPIACVILIGLFLRSGSGTAKVGRAVRPGDAGVVRRAGGARRRGIVRNPRCWRRSIRACARLRLRAPGAGPSSCCRRCSCRVTGGEALYADMGHFGRRPIRLAWFASCSRRCCSTTSGRARWCCSTRRRRENPFFLLAPTALLPLVVLRHLRHRGRVAGDDLGRVLDHAAGGAARLPAAAEGRPHLGDATSGQIYVPAVNWR